MLASVIKISLVCSLSHCALLSHAEDPKAHDRKGHSSASLRAPSLGGNTPSRGLQVHRTEGEILLSPNLKAFTYSELKNATKNFRPDSLIGEGGFGHVYKGWIDEHTLEAVRPGAGMVVAVKKLKPEGFQGHKEWLVVLHFFFACPVDLSGLIVCIINQVAIDCSLK